MFRRLATALILTFLCSPNPAQGFVVFQDSTDTGNNSGTPALVTIGVSTHINLYVHHGTILSDLACSGAGSGDELCGWDILLGATGGMQLLQFVPEDSNAVVWRLTPTMLHAARVDPTVGVIGAQRVGRLTVRANGAGTVEVTGNLFVDASLTATPVPQSVVAVTDSCQGLGGDTDFDGICDDGDSSGVAGDHPCSCGNSSPESCRQSCDDNCPWAANSDQLDRGGIGLATPDGDGDRCQCGDVTGDGVVNSADATMITRWAIGLSAKQFNIPGNCDVTSATDDSCNSSDATIITREALGLPPGAQRLCPNAHPPGVFPQSP
jgi:hypothetical protein